MLKELIGTLVWLAANGLYIDMKRKGRGGLARIILFWMGTPATWLWFFLIPEGKKRKELPAPADDYESLLEEIKRERAMEGRLRESDAMPERPHGSSGRDPGQGPNAIPDSSGEET